MADCLIDTYHLVVWHMTVGRLGLANLRLLSISHVTACQLPDWVWACCLPGGCLSSVSLPVLWLLCLFVWVDLKLAGRRLAACLVGIRSLAVCAVVVQLVLWLALSMPACPGVEHDLVGFHPAAESVDDPAYIICKAYPGTLLFKWRLR